MPLDFMELLTKIPNEQEIRLVTNTESIIYAGKCGDMPFSIVKEASEMMVISVMAAGDNLCLLLEGIEEFDIDFDDDDFEDFDSDMPFN